jgi:hypothetical protein
VAAASWGPPYVEVVDRVGPYRFPGAFDPAGEELERALIEIDAAIELVARRGAVRISLIGFGITDLVAGVGAARAQEARVGFHVERHEEANAGRSIVIGPVSTE